VWAGVHFCVLAAETSTAPSIVKMTVTFPSLFCGAEIALNEMKGAMASERTMAFCQKLNLPRALEGTRFAFLIKIKTVE
jgi:hypothetical protein